MGFFGQKSKDCYECTSIEDKIAEDWISEIIPKIQNGWMQKRAINIGKLPKEVIKYAVDNNIELTDSYIQLLDKQIAHALRSDKVLRGQAISNQQMIRICSNLRESAVYYDDKKKNFIFVFYDNGQYIKYVIQPNHNTKANGKKMKSNFFITAGKIDITNINQSNFKKIR